MLFKKIKGFFGKILVEDPIEKKIEEELKKFFRSMKKRIHIYLCLSVLNAVIIYGLISAQNKYLYTVFLFSSLCIICFFVYDLIYKTYKSLFFLNKVKTNEDLKKHISQNSIIPLWVLNFAEKFVVNKKISKIIIDKLKVNIKSHLKAFSAYLVFYSSSAIVFGFTVREIFKLLFNP